MDCWQPDDEPRRLPWVAVLAGAGITAVVTALVLYSQSAGSQQPVTLIAMICERDPETARFTRDCARLEDAAATVADCKETAAWLRATAPAGLKVIAAECFKDGRETGR